MNSKHPHVLASGLIVAVWAAVVYPWFTHRGFLFLLDFVWTPVFRSPAENPWPFFSTIPHQWILYWLSNHIGPEIIQKIYFASIILLSGISSYYLIWTFNKSKITYQATVSASIASVWYMLTPFAIHRIFMGQHYVLLQYALTSIVLLSFLQWIANPTEKRGLLAGSIIALTIISSIHAFFMLPILLMPLLFSRNIQFLQEKRAAWLLLPLSITAVIFIIWHAIIPPQNTLNTQGAYAFAPQPLFSPSILLDSLLLTANWKTDFPFHFTYQNKYVFIIITIFLALIGSWGWYKMIRSKKRRPLAIALAFITTLSILLAAGVSNPTLKPIATWMYQKIPFWIAMRDSAKFLGLVAVIQALCLGTGLIEITRVVKNKIFSWGFICLCIAATLCLLAPTLRGFSRQILPATYPTSWEQLNTYLREAASPQALFLPWHLYLSFNFTNQHTIANPAPNFFTQATVIAGDNEEIGGTANRPFIYSESTRPISFITEEVIHQFQTGKQTQGFGQAFNEYNIPIIILDTSVPDAKNYLFLFTQQDLKEVFAVGTLHAWKYIEK